MSTTRRLAAILAADVVGYSRLIELDEAGTLAALRERRRAILQPLVVQHHGRIVKVMGDGVLVEFASAVNAVQCAVELQQRFGAANEGLPDARRIELRAGVNLGDVVVDSGDLFGDGVIIAVRLQAMAEPGGITISGSVHDQVAGKLAAAFDDLGPRAVKNSAKSVQVYRVRTGSELTVARQAPDPFVSPSLAVLPFNNLSGDPAQDYFADGVVEDIIGALSRFKSFAVIARNSSFVYKGRAIDVRQVAKDLGVRYVLEGSVRRAGGTLRLAAQLVDGVTGAHLWAQSFDGALDEVFHFQDRITESVATLVEPLIEVAEIKRSRTERPKSVALYDMILRAHSKLSTQLKEDNAEAYALLTEALALAPDNARILGHSVMALSHRISMGWPPIGTDDVQRCSELARRALRLASGDATVMAMCGVMLVHTAKDYNWGMAAIHAATDANPNSMEVVIMAGIAHLHCGSVADALDLFHRAIRLSPRDPSAHFSLTGIAHAQMILGNFAEALNWAERSLVHSPNFNATLWMLIAGNAQLGRMVTAQRYLAEFKKIAPNVTVSRIWAGQPQMDPSRMANILAGLRLAGLPEGPEPEPAIPSLAVLPFQNMSGDPEQAYFADGIADDIITALSRFKSFAVIARNSSFTYKGRAVDVRQVAKDLGVRYVLEGSVRRAGAKLRITAQLADGTSGAHLWARNFDGALDDVFDFQDRITESVATLVEPHIQSAEIERSRRERPGSIAVYDLYLRAMAKIFSDESDAVLEACDLLDDALNLEPDNASILAYAAFATFVRNHFRKQQGDAEKCAELARRALQHAAGDATVLALCGIALIHLPKDYVRGMAALLAALEANPNSSLIVGNAGVGHLHCGDIEQALTLTHRAIRLSPRDAEAHYSLTGIAHAHMVLGNYAEALDWAARSLALGPNYFPTFWMLIAANAHLGRLGEAHRFLAEFRRLAPGTTVASIWSGQPQKYADRMANILEGLRMAGLEEG